MLTITFKKIHGAIPIDNIYERSFSWRVRTEISVELEEEIVPSDEGWVPVIVEASGEELVWMGRNFTNIPRANPVMNPIQKWRGDFAAFIYDHLPRKE